MATRTRNAERAARRKYRTLKNSQAVTVSSKTLQQQESASANAYDSCPNAEEQSIVKNDKLHADTPTQLQDKFQYSSRFPRHSVNTSPIHPSRYDDEDSQDKDIPISIAKTTRYSQFDALQPKRIPVSLRSASFNQYSVNAQEKKYRTAKRAIIGREEYEVNIQKKAHNYRSWHGRALCIPIRKFSDLVETRIVNILNKMLNEKDCQRELESIVKKIVTLSPRELFNRYIISGFKTILSLAESNSLYQPSLITKLKQALRILIEQINKQLDDFEGFNEPEQTTILNDEDHKKMIRKVYLLLKRLKKIGKNSNNLKLEAVTYCQGLQKENIENAVKKLWRLSQQ